MTSLQSAFKKKAFIGYLTVGQRGLEASLQAALALIEGGVDILELGIPFSDPIGEGEAIQKAMTQALQEKTTPEDVLSVVKSIRANSQIPMILISYYNPLLIAGELFYQKSAQAGANGMIVVDLPPEEASDHCQMAKSFEMDTIFLASPTTSASRLDLITRNSSGFLYYAMQAGTREEQKELPAHYAANMHRLRHATSLPIAAGFEISHRSMAEKVLECADGFIVGSAFVDLLNRGGSFDELRQLAKSLDPR